MSLGRSKKIIDNYLQIEIVAQKIGKLLCRKELYGKISFQSTRTANLQSVLVIYRGN